MLILLEGVAYCCGAYSLESKLPEVFDDIREAHEKIDARLKAEHFKVCSLKGILKAKMHFYRISD